MTDNVKTWPPHRNLILEAIHHARKAGAYRLLAEAAPQYAPGVLKCANEETAKTNSALALWAKRYGFNGGGAET